MSPLSSKTTGDQPDPSCRSQKDRAASSSDMRHRHLRLLTLLAVLIITTISSGCSIVRHPTSESEAPVQNLHAPSLSQGTSAVNLETLENDPLYLRDAAPEVRALKLSELWYERSLPLQSLPGPGYLASLLRSAQLALEFLITDTCRNPFNRTCPALDRAYTRAVDGVVRFIAVRGWKPPNLAPSRYSFDPSVAAELANLEGWKITLPESSEHGPLLRPGLGVPVIGCRDLQISGVNQSAASPLICSPITFIISFDSPSSAEAIHVRLIPLDAYQQEVIQIANQETLLSGNIDGTVEALARNVQTAHPRPRLSCLSVPTRTTTSLILLGRSSSFTQLVLDQVRRIPSEPALREHYTPCFYSLPDSTTPAVAAKDLLQTLREIVTPRGSARLERAPTPIFIAAIDDLSVCTADEVLQRMKRQDRLINRGRVRGAPFVAHGVFALRPHESSNQSRVCAEALARDASELGAAFGPSQNAGNSDRADAHLLLLRDMLFATRSPAHTPPRSTTSNPPPLEAPSEPLPVSPVL